MTKRKAKPLSVALADLEAKNPAVRNAAKRLDAVADTAVLLAAYKRLVVLIADELGVGPIDEPSSLLAPLRALKEAIAEKTAECDRLNRELAEAKKYGGEMAKAFHEAAYEDD